MSNFTETQIVQAVAKAAYAGKLKSVTIPLHELTSIVNYLPQPNQDDERAWHRVRRHPALMQRDNVARTHEQIVERVMDRLDELEALEGVVDQQQRWQDWYDQHRIVQQEQQRQEQLRSERIQYKHAPQDEHPQQQLVHAIRRYLPDAWNNAEPQPYEEDLVNMSWQGLSEYTKVHVTDLVYQVMDRVITRGELNKHPLAQFVKHEPVHSDPAVQAPPNPDKHKHILVYKASNGMNPPVHYSPPLQMTWTGNVYQDSEGALRAKEILAWAPATIVASTKWEAR